MVPVPSLWLAILLSAVAVFVLSSILHMVLPFHRKDYRQLPNEEETRAALRKAGLAPGLYHYPWAAGPKEMGSPEVVARFTEGPVGILVAMPSGPPKMGKFLGLWFGYCVLVSIFLAYLAACTMGRGEEPMHVARVVGSAAFLAYGLANIVDSIWKGYPWGMTAKNVFDGLLYSVASAAVFAWLWPR
jgi:hypothetical protein